MWSGKVSWQTLGTVTLHYRSPAITISNSHVITSVQNCSLHCGIQGDDTHSIGTHYIGTYCNATLTSTTMVLTRVVFNVMVLYDTHCNGTHYNAGWQVCYRCCTLDYVVTLSTLPLELCTKFIDTNLKLEPIGFRVESYSENCFEWSHAIPMLPNQSEPNQKSVKFYFDVNGSM